MRKFVAGRTGISLQPASAEHLSSLFKIIHLLPRRQVEMPPGDEKHKLIYDEMVNILGSNYVSDDPGVTLAYSRDCYAVSTLRRRSPEFIVLPGSTEDVQQILRLANRYQFPYSVIGTGFLFVLIGAVKPYWCLIDTKRLNRLEIDDKNMYAIIEPYVTHAIFGTESQEKYSPMPTEVSFS